MKMTKTLLIASIIGFGLIASHAAKADGDDYDHGGYGDHYDHARHDGQWGHDRWRHDDDGYYPPPPAYYAPPPPVYYAPPIITFGFRP
ncbi:MAG: hypothetical protein POG74_00050 [Acidocella sp.]|nr:hypothetical protein [Acidocella sp.]